MTEQDPLELLSAEVGRPEQPDAAFAANLLDHLLEDLADGTSSDATPFHIAADVDMAEDEASGDTPAVEVLELVAAPEPIDDPSNWGGWALRVAAIVLLIVGGVALLTLGVDDGTLPVRTTDTEDSPPVTVEDDQSVQALDANEQLVTDFLNARNAYDGPAMRELVADDASIVNEVGVETRNDYLLRSEFDRLMNTELSNIACSSLTPERVSCLFSIQTDIGRHMRPDGYVSEVVATVSDGSIVDLLAGEECCAYENDGAFFLGWLGRTHPDDVAVVAQESTLRIRATPESGAVVAARLPEFVASTMPPITTLLAEDPRFTSLIDALNRTRVANSLSSCDGSEMTLFAPTTDAIDRYVTSSGLDRDDVLDDVAFFEALVVAETVALADVAELDDESIDLATLSGDTITVTGGSVPRVQGIPIVGEVAGTAACNGVFYIIDEIYLSDSQ